MSTPADSFKVLGEPKRLRLADLMASGEVTVSELVTQSGFPQSTVSRHLTQFREAGLVRVRRAGNLRYYTLDIESVKKAGLELDRLIRKTGLTSGAQRGEPVDAPKGPRRRSQRSGGPPPPPAGRSVAAS